VSGLEADLRVGISCEAVEFGGAVEQDLVHVPGSGRGAVVEQVADALGGVGEQFVDAAVAFERLLLDLVAGAQEGAAGGEVADDAGVGAGVAGGGTQPASSSTARLPPTRSSTPCWASWSAMVSVSIGSWRWCRASIAV